MPNFSFYGDVSDVKISFYLSELGYGSQEGDFLKRSPIFDKESELE